MGRPLGLGRRMCNPRRANVTRRPRPPTPFIGIGLRHSLGRPGFGEPGPGRLEKKEAKITRPRDQETTLNSIK